MLFEDDNVGVRNNFRVSRGEDWSGVFVDGLSAEGGCCCRKKRQREGDKTTHDERSTKVRDYESARDFLVEERLE